MEFCVDHNPEEWKNPKLGELKIRIGGSDVGTACGVGYPGDDSCNPNKIYLEKRAKMEGIDITSHEKDPVTEHGQRCEPIVAQTYATITGNRITNANYWLSKEFPDLYGASPDRKVYLPKDPSYLKEDNCNNNNSNRKDDDDDFDGLLEIKAPYGKMYTEPKRHHIAQMMFEMWTVGKKTWCDYCAQLIKHEDSEEEIGEEIMLKRIYYNEKYVEEWMLPRLFYMSDCIMRGKNPDLTVYKDPPLPVRIDDLVGDLYFTDYYELD